MAHSKQEIMARLQSDYDLLTSEGYEVVGIFLQGSQNYDLAYEESDIDTKAIVLPKFEDIIMNKAPTSTTRVLDNPKQEHIDIKDIRLMFNCFKKQNINFIEVLFTEYKVMNPKYVDMFEPMFIHKEEIARYNNYGAINCMCGMVMEKYKALEHPYPATMDKIEKFGYDPKQLHHIIRIYEFMQRYIDDTPYAECLIPQDTKSLIEIKKGCIEHIEAKDMATILNVETKDMKNRYMDNVELNINEHARKVMDDVLLSTIRLSLKDEIMEDL